MFQNYMDGASPLGVYLVNPLNYTPCLNFVTMVFSTSKIQNQSFELENLPQQFFIWC